MVDSQIRPNRVHDLRVIEAMRLLPREAFAPAGMPAYADTDLDLGGGRFMLQPMNVARLAQLALADLPAHALVIGAGSGYLAAMLSLAGLDVVALEEETRLTSPALAAYAPKAQAVMGPLRAGWPSSGPYDVIIIEGAVMEIPPVLAAQLSPGGRVVTILVEEPVSGALGHIVVGEPVNGGFSLVEHFDCAARPLPQFTPAPAFCFRG
jgi:protein-L-isoaspartate(D-aspartate) O-methyltransferase